MPISNVQQSRMLLQNPNEVRSTEYGGLVLHRVQIHQHKNECSLENVMEYIGTDHDRVRSTEGWCFTEYGYTKIGMNVSWLVQ